MAEPSVLIGLPVKWGNPHIPACNEHPCVKCGQGVWVAPSGEAAIRDHNLQVMCVPCGARSMNDAQTRGEEIDVQITEMQKREVLDALRRDRM